MLQRETGSKSYRCYRFLQRGCNGKRSWESIIHCSVEGQMQREFQKLQRQSATTDCNGKVLPLEAATGRWIRREKRGDRENDGELEMGKFELAAEHAEN